MVPDIGRVVASAAETRNTLEVEVVVEAGDSGDIDVRIVENLLAAGDRLALREVIPGGQPKPGPVEIEDLRRELGAGWVMPEGVVDADKETGKLQRQRNGSTLAAVLSQVPSV